MNRGERKIKHDRQRELWGLEECEQTHLSDLASPRATNVAGSNLTCPLRLRPRKGHEATRHQSISSKTVRVYLPTTSSGAGAQELNPLGRI